MNELLTFIVSKIVDHPDDVSIKEIAGEQTCVYELRVHKEDLGKIIGKQGKTARALRTLLAAAAVKDKKRVMLEIID